MGRVWRECRRRCRRPSTSRMQVLAVPSMLADLVVPRPRTSWAMALCCLTFKAASGSLRMVTVLMCLLLPRYLKLGPRLTRSIFDCVICRACRFAVVEGSEHFQRCSRGRGPRAAVARTAAALCVRRLLPERSMIARSRTLRPDLASIADCFRACRCAGCGLDGF